MRVDRFTLLHGLRAAAIRERERRQTAAAAPGMEAKERLIAELDAIAERAPASPGWREPTAEERREGLAHLAASFRERGYPQLASACAKLLEKAL